MYGMPKTTALFLIILLSGLFTGLQTTQNAAANPADFWSEATLYRDAWGVPHILAESPRAMAFVFGYAQAEDHLETMLLAYRTANGTAAAVLGDSYADSDAFSLRMGHARLAREAWPQLDSLTRALCEGFAMGVNAWIMDHPNRTPEWAEGVHPADILALWHAFIMSQAPFDLPDKYRRPRAMETGNTWALAPDRTREGKTLLVINPHQYHDGPFQWYEAHLLLGDINVYGATLKGLPIIVQGHNQHLGWGLTPNAPDTADMYQEQFQTVTRNPRDPRRSVELLPLEQALALHYMSQAQSYYVRTAAGLEERFTPAYIGPRGPIFEGFGGDLHSWRIGGYYDFGGLRQLFDMGRAQDLDSFGQALNQGQIPTFHVLYADREGNLFYLYNAKTGVRVPQLQEERNADAELPPELQQAYQRGLNWREPLPAHYESIAWGSYIPLQMLPRVQNPESGFIQATGNPPWTVTDDVGMDPRAWPGWLVNDRETYRAQRVRQLLRQGRRSFTDMQSMLYDQVVPAAVEMVPMLLTMADQRPDLMRGAHPDMRAGLDILRNWDRSASTQSTGMTFYHVWWAMLQARTARDFNSDAARYHAILNNSEAAQSAALRAADDAARMMRNDFQTVSIPWGEVHRIRRGNREEAAPGSGTGEPIFIASDYAIENKRWQTTYGYGLALAVEFGESPKAVSVAPFGASDNPDSPHFDDQMDLMLQQRFKPTRFTPDAVWRHAAYGMGRRITLQALGTEAAVHIFAAQPVQAQLSTRQRAPEELPEGLAAYSLFLRPERVQAQTPVELLLEFEVPAGVASPEALPYLQLYRYTANQGWQPLAQQQFNPQTGVFSGQDGAPALYALLGPEAYLAAPPTEQLEPTVPLPPLIAQTPEDVEIDLEHGDSDTSRGVALPPVESLPIYHPFPMDPPMADAAPPLMPRDPAAAILPWGDAEDAGAMPDFPGPETPEIEDDVQWEYPQAPGMQPGMPVRSTEDGSGIEIAPQHSTPAPQSLQQGQVSPEEFQEQMEFYEMQQRMQQQRQQQQQQSQPQAGTGGAPAPFPQMIQPPPPSDPQEEAQEAPAPESVPSAPVQRNFGPRQRR